GDRSVRCVFRVRPSEGYNKVHTRRSATAWPGIADHSRRRADGWRTAEPKTKFIVINLPFKQLAVKKLTVRKKTVMAIYAEEAREGEGTVSAIFWDGKKYKYQPLGSTME